MLQKGDAVASLEEGETLDGGYRVESIGAGEITLLYIPLGVRERLPVAVTLGVDERVAKAAGALVSRQAQVRWEGPERVQPGKLFGGDGFAYRVSPGGSIFVGTSGRARAPGNVAADAELVVLSFRPIRPAAAAEVKISSLLLQGEVGKAIVVALPAAYRTAITP